VKTIRVLRNTGSHLPRFTEGQVVDVADETAVVLCSLHVAEVLRTIPVEPMKAVPEEPAIMAVDEESQPKQKRNQKTKLDSKE
jgi:hypothetical protein